jgi:hypothetical protein
MIGIRKLLKIRKFISHYNSKGGKKDGGDLALGENKSEMPIDGERIYNIPLMKNRQRSS